MTKEEAVKELSVLWERMKRAKESGVLAYKTIMYYDGQYVEALNIAIKALEQQPCEDCISRQEAISAIQDKYYDNAIGIDIVDMIAHMPTAIPEQLGEHFAEGYKKGIENE